MSTRNFLILVGGILAVLFLLLALAVRGEMDSGEPDVAEETAESPGEEAETKETAEKQEQDDEEETETAPSTLNLNDSPLYAVNDDTTPVFQHQSGVDIAYPKEGVKGIFVTGFSAGGERMQELTELVNNTELNSMVIDVKEDIGDIMMPIDVDNEIAQSHMYDYVNPEQLMTTLEDNQIYPIARIVVFKDSRLAMDRPDLSYQNSDGTVWQNGSGESFVNPFLKEVWDYNVDIAIEAAKLGFKEIQFDYVRFPESFETLSADLTYNLGEYGDTETDEVQQRVNAVTDFVAYANEQLKSYDVDVSVDVFGYAATQREAPGIGQNFSQIANNVDIISSMIYPSHWGAGAFDFATPDTEPYAVIDEYMKVENEVLGKLEDPPKSRPWIQDFTASYLGPGNYINYGAAEVEAQIQALKDNGVEEYLLWNAQNTYSEGTEYQ